MTVIAIAFYAFIEVSKSYQQARSDAVQEYATRVELLNKQQETTYAGIESLRSSQLDTVEKLANLSTLVIDSIEKNQTMLLTARDEVANERAAQVEAEAKLREAQRKQEESAAALRQQEENLHAQEAALWAAESTIDIANRLTTFVTTSLGAPVELDRTYLSRVFESASPDTIRRDAQGTVYYGAYRIPGRDIPRFMEFLKQRFPHLFLRLSEAGGADAAQTGEDSFRYEWTSLSRDRQFRAAQDTYLEETYYGPLVDRINERLRKAPGVNSDYDIASGSKAMKAVLWSIAVQHGLQPLIVVRGVDGLDLKTADAETLIKAIYAERRHTDRYYPNESDDIKRLLEARYVFEEQVALKMLAAEGSGGTRQ